jgi:hypothetical protein
MTGAGLHNEQETAEEKNTENVHIFNLQAKLQVLFNKHNS